MRTMRIVRAVTLSVLLICWCYALCVVSLDLYCGPVSCYDVLDVPVDASQSDIKRAYYRLSLSLHPDKNKTESAAVDYLSVVSAYEVLSDPASRRSYDAALAHPDRFMRNRYEYYKYQAARRIDPVTVVTTMVVLATVLHYAYVRHRYFTVRKGLAEHPTVQTRIAAEVKRQMVDDGQNINDVALVNRRIREESANNIERYVNVVGSESKPPTWRDLVPIQLALIPLRLGLYVAWQIKWIVAYSVLSYDYNAADAEYATAAALGLRYDKFMTLVPPEQRTALITHKVWIPENMKRFRQENHVGAQKKRPWNK